MTPVKEIDLQQLGKLRTVSQQIRQQLDKRLTAYVATVRPLFSPRKVLGEFMESAFKDPVPGATRNFELIKKRYEALTRETFKFKSKLGGSVRNIQNKLSLAPWEYVHTLESGRKVAVTSSVRWVLSYESDYTHRDLLQQQIAGEPINENELTDLIVRTLTMWRMVDQVDGLSDLFKALRFPVTVETNDTVSGDLPYVVLSAEVPSFRPQDELIDTVIQLSGKPVFEELIDTDGVRDIPDPFREAVQALVDAS